jgi:hypothetical protein
MGKSDQGEGVPEENEGCRDIHFKETMRHLGGRRISGALVYVGTRRVGYSGRRLRLYVNGKPGWTYHISITVSGADLYDIEMWGKRGNTRKLLGRVADLYFDELQAAVEKLYDTVMDETNDGFIPLS